VAECFGKEVASFAGRRVNRPVAINIHHLELFYYVAKHGGISRAVRHMPYGIQQPALSGQILKLEEDLAVKLFERQPFKLTEAGEELMAFIQPFFDNVEAVGVSLRSRLVPRLRIGSSELVLRDYLPAVVERMRVSHPGLRLSLRSGFQAELMGWLNGREIELAVLPMSGRPPAGFQRLALMQLPLVLLVNRKSKLKNAAELWRDRQPAEPLISLPSTEILSVLFQQGLKRRRVNWTTAIEASSMELITRYVANGDGIGASIAVPHLLNDTRVRVLALDDFPPLELSALWPGAPSPLLRTFLAEAQRYIRENWPQAALVDQLRL